MELKLTSSFHPMNVFRWFFLCIHLKWNLLMWLFFYKYLLLKFLTWLKCKHKMNYRVVLRNLKWKGRWNRWEHESIVTYNKPENRPKFTSKSKMWLEKWERWHFEAQKDLRKNEKINIFTETKCYKRELTNPESLRKIVSETEKQISKIAKPENEEVVASSS